MKKMGAGSRRYVGPETNSDPANKNNKRHGRAGAPTTPLASMFSTEALAQLPYLIPPVGCFAAGRLSLAPGPGR
jgi:hypothetical protein